MTKHNIWVVKLAGDRGFLRHDDLDRRCHSGNFEDMRAFTCPSEARGAAKAVFGEAISLRDLLSKEYVPEESVLCALRELLRPNAMTTTTWGSQDVTVWRS